MNKQKGVLIPLLAISVVLLLGYQGFGWKDSLKNEEFEKIVTSLIIVDWPEHEAWQIFENYLEFARTHNLPGVRSLSHQISAICNDPTKEKECFALMDNVYAIGSSLKAGEFKHVQADERQIIMFTDGPTVAILYFTRDKSGAPKVLGLRFCFEDESTTGSCVETNPDKRDKNGNGWWDSVESLFYK